MFDKKRQMAAVACCVENGPIVASSSPKRSDGDPGDLGHQDADGDTDEPLLTILNAAESAVNPPSPCVVVRLRVGFAGL